MLLLEGPTSAYKKVPDVYCSIRRILWVGLLFIKANYKSINMIIRNNITTSSALFLEKLASKHFRKRLNWIDWKQEEEGNVDRYRKSVGRQSRRPTYSHFQTYSDLLQPTAQNSCFFTIMQTAGRQVRCDKVAQVL